MLALFLTLSLDLHKPVCNRSENAFVAIFGTGFVAVAAIASHLLQTNYSNFLRCTVGFVAELVEKLKLVIGELPTTVIYTAVLALLHVLIMLLANYLFMLACVFKKRMQEKSKKSIHPISPSN